LAVNRTVQIEQVKMKFFPLLCCAAFLLCGLSDVCAQAKSVRVEEYLGSFRYENDKPKGTVKFIFQRAVLTREGNGRKSYKQLLSGQRGYSNNDNAGDLLAVQVVDKGETLPVHPEPKGKKSSGRPVVQQTTDDTPTPSAPPELVRPRRGATRVAPAQVPEGQTAAEPQPTEQPQPQPSTDPVRPRPLGGNGARSTTSNINLPDSMALVQSLDGAKQTMTGWKARLWQSAQPIWEFVMWIFNSVIVLLICFAGLCRYVAKTAAAESKISPKGRVITGRWIIGAHQNASGLLLIITWFIAIFFLIDIFMWLIYLNLSIWLLVVIWFPTLWLAEKITGWIVPNLRGDEYA
jgi:hypothetical protein